MSAELGTLTWRTSDWYASRISRGTIVGAALAIALAIVYAVALVATDGEVLLLVPLAAVIVTVAVVAHPPAGVYLLFGAALLFEQFAIQGLAPLTAQAHVIENISEYTPIPVRLSLVDVLTLLTVASWAFRRLAGQVNEVRAPVQLCLAYFLATNLIRHRGQVAILMSEFVVLVGVKAAQGILNYLESQSLGVSLEAVTSHEDVVFFDVAAALMLVVALLSLRSRLGYTLLALQPVILGAEVLTQRRVGFIALGTVVLAMMILSLAVNARRGLALAAIGALAFGAYAAFFWDETGPIAEPLRALQTVVDPSEKSARDAGSDHWRDIENRNIAFTIKELPLTGVGAGQQYFFQEEPPPLPASFPYWRYITHNAVLWLWLKAGPLGAFAIWFLVSRAVLVGSSLFVRLRDPALRWAATLPVAVIVCQIVFSSVDLGLSYSRTMLVLGTALGLTAALADPRIARSGSEQ